MNGTPVGHDGSMTVSTVSIVVCNSVAGKQMKHKSSTHLAMGPTPAARGMSKASATTKKKHGQR